MKQLGWILLPLIGVALVIMFARGLGAVAGRARLWLLLGAVPNSRRRGARGKVARQTSQTGEDRHRSNVQTNIPVAAPNAIPPYTLPGPLSDASARATPTHKPTATAAKICVPFDAVTPGMRGPSCGRAFGIREDAGTALAATATRSGVAATLACARADG